MDVNYEIAEEVAALERDEESEENYLTEEQTAELYSMIFSDDNGLLEGVEPSLEELLKDFLAEIAREQGHEEIKNQWEKIKADKNEKILLEFQASQKKIGELEQRLSERNSEIENLQSEMVKNSQIVAISQTRNLENERRKLLEQYNQEIARMHQQHETEINGISLRLKEKENELFEIKEKYVNLKKENEIKEAFMYADKTEIEAGIREALAEEKEAGLADYAKSLKKQGESIENASNHLVEAIELMTKMAQTIHDSMDYVCGSEERIKQEVAKAAEMFFEIKLYPKLKRELTEELKGHKGLVETGEMST